MSMFDPKSDTQRSPSELTTWLHDQVGALKAQIGRIEQQSDQFQAALLDLNEKQRDAEGRLRELTARTIGLPVLTEQIRQLSGLLDRIQDAEVLIDTKFELIERTRNEERTRDQAEKNDLYHRVQDLERRTESLLERQSSVDDANRRFQEESSRSHLQLQAFNQRLESVESKSGRNVDAVNRLEQSHAELESAIRSLRREDDVLAERARLAHEVAGRLETDLHAHQEEFRAVPLLAERVELLRAERQRVEDRVSRLEETLNDGVLRLEREEEATTHVDVRLKAHEGRIDHVHTTMLEYRRYLSEKLLKLHQMLERMSRRQMEELDRDAKEFRLQANKLKNEDDEP